MFGFEKALYFHAPHGVILLSQDSDSLRWHVSGLNPVAEKLTGLSLDGSLQQDFRALLSPDVYAHFAMGLKQSRYTIDAVRFDASVEWCTCEMVHHHERCVVYLYPTEPAGEASAGRLLDASNSFTDLIMESIPGYFFVKDEQFRLVLFNSNFKNLYPEPMRDSILGTTTLEHYNDKERDEFLAMDKQAFAQGSSVTEETIQFPDGQTRTLLTRKIRFEDNDGTPYILGLASDITAYKDARETIEQQNIELEQRARQAQLLLRRAEDTDKAKSVFLANMSHEMRTPLHGIQGMSRILMDSGLGETQTESVQTIAHCGDMLLALVNDVLDLAKVEAGELVVDLDGHVAIRDIIADLEQLLGPVADKKALRLEVTCDDSVPDLIYGDTDRIRQVLINLVNNALKFTQSGSVCCRIQYDALRFILQLEVEDTGLGIPVAKQAEIFNAFTQVEPNNKPSDEGAGLGLAISKKLCDVMDGSIDLDSTLGKGSLFRVAIPSKPVVAAEEAVASAPAAVQERDLTGIRVLIVEDNLVNGKIAMVMCTKLGYVADHVVNGVEALAQLSRERYDLVFMDCQMPVLDGYEATRRLRDGQDGVLDPAVPVIALTAHAMKGDRQRCLQAGMNDYCTKPFSLADVQRLACAWVQSTPADKT